MADAEISVASLQAQLGEASPAAATSDSHWKLAKKGISKLAAGKRNRRRELRYRWIALSKPDMRHIVRDNPQTTSSIGRKAT